MTQIYTASRLRVFRECHRKHLYRYVLRIQTPSTPAMAFGTNAHKALEAWFLAWQRLDLRDGDHRLTDAFITIDELEDCDEVDRIRLRALVAAYHARWGNEPWEVLGVELEFSYYLGTVEIRGKIDALVRNTITGEIFVVEHKTSRTDTSAGSPYWDRLCIDTQVSIYIDGATVLGHQIAGCIYDVLKRPAHEPLMATPLEARKYTIGKGCKDCGGSAKPGAVERGRGYLSVAFASEVKQPPCAACAGTGWKLDKDGEPQEPRLHANQRDEDETLEAFAERLLTEIASCPDDYLHRGVVVRLDSELPRMRQELLDTIAELEALDRADLHAPNHDACVKGRDLCPFFAACSGRASIDDHYLFPRSDSAHPELPSAAA